VQGRGDAAEQTIHDAIAVQESGAIARLLGWFLQNGHPDHRQADHSHRRHRRPGQL